MSNIFENPFLPPIFNEIFDAHFGLDKLHRQVERIAAAKCEYEYPWGVCNRPAVVSSIESGIDYCSRHAKEMKHEFVGA